MLDAWDDTDTGPRWRGVGDRGGHPARWRSATWADGYANWATREALRRMNNDQGRYETALVGE